MQDAVYALPGFMPPSAPHWRSNILTSETGAIKLCVHAGEEGDKVYYCLDIPGWKHGFIKDATYFEDNNYPEHILDRVKDYPNYLSVEDSIGQDVVVPVTIINDWPIPITERPIENKKYWVLTLPDYVLPVGPTKVSVDINGRVKSYIIQRPEFSIHKKPDRTKLS